MHMPSGQRSWIFGVWAIDGCELSDMGAGNQTWQVLLTAELSLLPFFFFFFFVDHPDFELTEICLPLPPEESIPSVLANCRCALCPLLAQFLLPFIT